MQIRGLTYQVRIFFQCIFRPQANYKKIANGLRSRSIVPLPSLLSRNHGI
jgi:hypothetical protein